MSTSDLHMQHEKLQSLLFEHSLDGYFFMMLDEPVEWRNDADNDRTLEYVFHHQRVTQINNAMLDQYRAKHDDFIGMTPADFFAHDMEQGYRVWRDFFNAGRLHIDTHEKRFDGTDMVIEGDYICLYDDQGRITGHFGIQRDVTEQRNQHKELLISQERSHFAIEASNDGIWDFDIERNNLFCSSKFKEILGYGRHDAFEDAENLFSAIHPSDMERESAIRQALQFGDLDEFNSEVRMRRKEGKYVWVRLRGKIAAKDGRGKPVRIIGAISNISDRKQFEEYLTFQRDLYENLEKVGDFHEALEIILNACMSIDDVDAGGIYIVNRETGELTLACHRHLSEGFVSEVSRYAADSENARLCQAGNVIYSVYPSLNNIEKGSVRDREGLRAMAVVPSVHEGKTVAVLNLASRCSREFTLHSKQMIESTASMIAGILTRLRIEERLRESQNNMESLFNTIDDFLFILDEQGMILKTNDAVTGRLKYSNDDIVRMNVLEMHPPMRRTEALDIVTRMMKGELAFCPIPLYASDGTSIPVETKITHGVWSGKPVLIGISRDISERKVLEEKILQRSNELEEANKELESFSYSISHDLRSPLRAVDGFTKLLCERSHLKLTDEELKLCAAIRENVHRMGTLIDDLLSFSRTSRTSVSMNEFDMQSLFDSVLESSVSESERQSVKVNFSHSFTVRGDQTMLRQVWVNLLSNAIKFTSKVPHRKIDVRGSIIDNDLILSISDNGVGFDMKYANKLFRVFQRLHSFNDYEGTGVGLALVQRIVQKHGGRIWAVAARNTGAAFYWTLPIERVVSVNEKNANECITGKDPI